MAKQRKREKGGPAVQLLIRLPLEVDERLEADARRCRPSKTRQVEAILVEFYKWSRPISRIPEIGPKKQMASEKIKQAKPDTFHLCEWHACFTSFHAIPGHPSP